MSADPYLKSAGMAADWPCGRGCYQSADKGFIIWFGEEDQLRIMCAHRHHSAFPIPFKHKSTAMCARCMQVGFVLNEPFDRLRKALDMVESIEGIKFATSDKCVT